MADKKLATKARLGRTSDENVMPGPQMKPRISRHQTLLAFATTEDGWSRNCARDQMLMQSRQCHRNTRETTVSTPPPKGYNGVRDLQASWPNEACARPCKRGFSSVDRLSCLRQSHQDQSLGSAFAAPRSLISIAIPPAAVALSLLFSSPSDQSFLTPFRLLACELGTPSALACPTACPFAKRRPVRHATAGFGWRLL